MKLANRIHFRRPSLLLTTGLAAVLLASPGAFAERLGGAYRGPEDAQTTKDTSQSTSPDTGGGDATSGGPSAGGSSESGGTVSGDSGGGDTGGGGGTSPPEGGGGGDTGGGGDSGGGGSDLGGGGGDGDGRSGGGGTGESSSGGLGAGGSGAGGGRGKAASGQQDALLLVSWYFEHNREKFLYEVAAERNRRLPPPKFSTPAIFSELTPDTRVRSSVTTEDRERIFDILNKMALAQEDVVRDAAVLALGKVGTPDAVEILRKRLKEESKTDIREDILLALGTARSPEAIEALAETLKTGRPNFHSWALLGLGLTRDPERAGPPALEWFQANLKRGRQAEDGLASAAIALGALAYPEAEAALIAAVKSKSTPDVVKAYAAHALGRIGTEACRKALESMLGQSQDVARSALLALGEFDDPATAKLLAGKEGLGRPDTLGSGFAALSLAKVLGTLPESEWKKYPDEIRAIALTPAKSALRAQYANLALSMIDGGVNEDVRRYYTEELKGTKVMPDLGAAIAMSCGVAGLGATDPMLQKVAREAGADPKYRSYAALALGMIGNASTTVETLRSVYAGTENPDVQRGAILGLGLVGDRRDVSFLLDVIVKTDPSRPFATYTRGAAVVALGMIRDGESVGRIQDLLRNPDPLVRAYAIAALGYLADKDASPALPQLFEHGNFRSEFRTLSIAMRNL